MLDFNEDKEVNIFDGTQVDVYDAYEFLVLRLGYVLVDKDLVVREPEEITQASDIQKGDIIPYITPDKSEIACVGYDVSRDEDIQRIVFAIGKLNSFEQDVSVGVNYYSLLNEGTFEMYTNYMDTFKDEHLEVVKNFKDVLVIEATREQFYDYLVKQHSRASEHILTVHHTDDEDDGGEYILESAEDIESGMFLFGELQREDGSPQIGLITYDVEDRKITSYLLETMAGSGIGIVDDVELTILRKRFDDVLPDGY